MQVQQVQFLPKLIRDFGDPEESVDELKRRTKKKKYDFWIDTTKISNQT